MQYPISRRTFFILSAIVLIAGVETLVYSAFRADRFDVQPRIQAELSAAQAQEYIRNTPNLLIIDTRTQQEYESGHLPGARNIPLHSFHSMVQDIPEGQPVLLHCLRGFRSLQAYRLLSRLRPDLKDIRYVSGQVTALPQ